MRIAFEGLDGTGKTTQINLLKEKGFNVFKSPNYGTPLGDLIKNRLFSKTFNHETTSLLFLSDLLETDKKTNNNKINILDRSFLSTLAYQNINFEIPKLLNFSVPEIIFYCEKTNKKIKNKDILEEENYQKKVEKNYQKVFNYYDIEPIILNNDKSILDIHKFIIEIIHGIFL